MVVLTEIEDVFELFDVLFGAGLRHDKHVELVLERLVYVVNFVALDYAVGLLVLLVQIGF